MLQRLRRSSSSKPCANEGRSVFTVGSVRREVDRGQEHPQTCVTMGDMRVDHVSYAAEHDGLHATAERLAKLIGVTPVDGGVHPRFGTRNVILPL